MSSVIEKFEDVETGVTLVPIPELDYDSSYLCDTENGRIYSRKSGRYLNPKGNSRFGYVYTSINGKPYSLHTLVMSAAMGMKKSWWREQGLEIDHIDMNKENNSIENLRLVTRKLNFTKAVRSKLGKGRRLSTNEVIQIKTEWLNFDGDKKSDFLNEQKDIYGTSYSCIEDIIKGKTWSHVSVEIGGECNAGAVQ